MALSDEEFELWLHYKTKNNQIAYLNLFEKYAPWSRVVAREVFRRIRVSDLEWCDYVQNASIGLMEAMTRYDIYRGIDFIAYAKPRVRGAVFNGLRSSLSPVSRRTYYVDWSEDRLSGLSELKSVNKLEGLVNQIANLALGIMFDLNSEQESQPRQSCPIRNSEQLQFESMLLSSLSVLSKKERYIIESHYYQYTSFVDIATTLGLTKGRVSQIHSAAIGKIRIHLRDNQKLKSESL